MRRLFGYGCFLLTMACGESEVTAVANEGQAGSVGTGAPAAGTAAAQAGSAATSDGTAGSNGPQTAGSPSTEAAAGASTASGGATSDGASAPAAGTPATSAGSPPVMDPAAGMSNPGMSNPGGTSAIGDDTGLNGAGLANAGGDGTAGAPSDDSPEAGAPVGGGAAGEATAETGGAGVDETELGGPEAGGEFILTSPELAEGAPILPESTCALNGFNNDESVPLAWTGAPEGTASFAIVFMDKTLVDAGQPQLGYHHVMYDIPADVTELPADLPDGAELTEPVAVKVYSASNPPSYLGPCPNISSGMAPQNPETHTYVFTLYALPTATLMLSGDVQTRAAAIEAAAIGSTALSGTSDASGSF